MASASRATLRMSSAAGLAAMRSSGATRASAALAGSSEGNGLSVTAIRTRGIRLFLCSRALLKHLRIDAVGRRPAGKQRKDVVDDDIGHLLAHFCNRAAEMRSGDHVLHLEQRRRHLGLVLEDVEAGAGELPFGKGARERGLVDDGAARGV